MGLPQAAVYRYALALITFLFAAASLARTAPVVTEGAGYARARAAAAARVSGIARRFSPERVGGRGAAGPGASPPAVP